MTYDETIDYLYTQVPMFQAIGAGAYKPGLETVSRLAAMCGNPQNRLRTIHVGGTNGKGSTAHTIAAVLQSAGYRVGLFTSPHLLDFRERIRIDGRMIERESVVSFVENYLAAKDSDMQPSFFELTTVMAFDYFARNNVDVAVIEVGLGGRLDSTNIITPMLSVITNISLDHTALLGHTPEAIASEKAGIIKPGVPAVIGESSGEVRRVFARKVAETGSEIFYADDLAPFGSYEQGDDAIVYRATRWGDISGSLCGDCQVKNAATILCALERLESCGLSFTAADVSRGFADVCAMTGLAGRWMCVREHPCVICDTGHNTGGWAYLSRRLAKKGKDLHMIIGFVNDKDVSGILAMMPRDARYYFVRASVPRALDSGQLAELAAEAGLKGKSYPTVAAGYEEALSQAKEGDTVFVGGSTFVVADLMALILTR